jgi:hypothetical protein
LFPSHWQGYQVVQNAAELKDQLTRFWSQT